MSIGNGSDGIENISMSSMVRDTSDYVCIFKSQKDNFQSGISINNDQQSSNYDVTNLENAMRLYLSDLKFVDNSLFECDVQLIKRLIELIIDGYSTDEKKRNELIELKTEIERFCQTKNTDEKRQIENSHKEVDQLTKEFQKLLDTDSLDSTQKLNPSIPIVNSSTELLKTHQELIEMEKTIDKLSAIIRIQQAQIEKLFTFISENKLEKRKTPSDSLLSDFIDTSMINPRVSISIGSDISNTSIEYQGILANEQTKTEIDSLVVEMPCTRNMVETNTLDDKISLQETSGSHFQIITLANTENEKIVSSEHDENDFGHKLSIKDEVNSTDQASTTVFHHALPNANASNSSTSAVYRQVLEKESNSTINNRNEAHEGKRICGICGEQYLIKFEADHNQKCLFS